MQATAWKEAEHPRGQPANRGQFASKPLPAEPEMDPPQIDQVTFELEGETVTLTRADDGRWEPAGFSVGAWFGSDDDADDDPGDAVDHNRRRILGMFLARGWVSPTDPAALRSVYAHAGTFRPETPLRAVKDAAQDSTGERIGKPEIGWLAAIAGGCAESMLPEEGIVRSVIAGFWSAQPQITEDSPLFSHQFWSRLETILRDVNPMRCAHLDDRAGGGAGLPLAARSKADICLPWWNIIRANAGSGRAQQ